MSQLNVQISSDLDEITALRMALQLAQRRAQRYEALLKQAPIGIVLLDSKLSRIINANPAFQQLVGYSTDEMAAFAFPDLLVSPYANFVEEVNRTRVKGEAAFQEMLIRHKNGQALPVELSILFPQDEEEGGFVVAIVRDLTTQRRAEETIRYQANLVQSVSDAIVSTDMNFCIQSWNRAAEELYGMTTAEVLEKSFSEILRVEYPGTDRIALLQKLERDGAWKGEQIHRHKDGTHIDILASVSYIWDSKGNRVGIVGVNRDITEQKRAERLLLLAEKSEHISLLASGIAHDFNNMLTSVFSQMALALRKLPIDNSARPHIEKAIKSTELMADLTRQLRAYTGQSAFQIEAVDLNQLVKDNLGLLEAFLPKHTRLELSLMSNLPTIELDRGQAQQLVMNLVINAIEAIQTGTGRIIIQTGEATLQGHQLTHFKSRDPLAPGRYVYLKVIDNGIGMSEATLARIFDPYFTTKPRGSGLGLSATLGIVQKYRGGLKVESQPAHGTTFTILFPASQAAVMTNHATATTEELSSTTILVVDDEASVREVVSDILAMQDIKTILATDGRDGIEKFEQYRTEIALVLLDMKMPVMNGEEAFYALRELDPNLKILISSGYNEPEITNRLLRQGPTRFLAKPYSPSALLEMVKTIIDL
ncbi:MAG: PAS domain S-box protein [Caldilineaceae bacterium]